MIKFVLTQFLYNMWIKTFQAHNVYSCDKINNVLLSKLGIQLLNFIEKIRHE